MEMQDNVDIELLKDEEDSSEKGIWIPSKKVLEKNILKVDVPPTKTNTTKSTNIISKEHISENTPKIAKGKMEKTKKQNIELKDTDKLDCTKKIVQVPSKNLLKHNIKEIKVYNELVMETPREPRIKKEQNEETPIATTSMKSKRERKETPKLKEYRSALIQTEKTESKPKAKKVKNVSKEDKVYTIEALLEKEGSMFLVKWENYTSLWNSWEPREGIPPFILKVIDLIN